MNYITTNHLTDDRYFGYDSNYRVWSIAKKWYWCVKVRNEWPER